MNNNRIQYAEAQRILQQLKDLKGEIDPIIMKDTSFNLLDKYAVIRRQLEQTSEYRYLNIQIKHEKQQLDIVIENKVKSLQNASNIQLVLQQNSDRNQSFPSDKLGQTYNSSLNRKIDEMEEHKSQEQLNILLSLKEELREYSMVDSRQYNQDEKLIKQRLLFEEIEVKQSKRSIVILFIVVIIILIIILLLFFAKYYLL
ncbi:hypothetical protein pb186bvf_019255 [Paramecium bursaria]